VGLVAVVGGQSGNPFLGLDASRRSTTPATEQQLASRTRECALTPEEEEEARDHDAEQVSSYRSGAVHAADYPTMKGLMDFVWHKQHAAQWCPLGRTTVVPGQEEFETQSAWVPACETQNNVRLKQRQIEVINDAFIDPYPS